MTITTGFTGTRKGMTLEQLTKFKMVIRELGTAEFHHGMCKGADENAADMILAIRFSRPIRIIGHPPEDTSQMAHYAPTDETLKPLPYLVRNRRIVDAVDHLVATPDGFFPKPRSGTWYTIHYAERQGVDVTIIYPDGSTNA